MKKNKNGNILLKLSVAVFGIWAVIFFVGTHAELSEKQLQLQNLEEQCEQVQQENNDIAAILTTSEGDEYIKDVARTKLGYVYPDERVYIDVSGN